MDLGPIRGRPERALVRASGALAFEGEEVPRLSEMTDEQHGQATRKLWELVDRFLVESGSILAVRDIYARHSRWSDELDRKAHEEAEEIRRHLHDPGEAPDPK